jgi:hypothetical protein
MEKYLSPYKPLEIKEIILLQKSVKGLFSYPTFRGTITETTIEIDTMESSPTFIRGSIKPVLNDPSYKSEITITISSVDNEKGPVMLLYVFSYLFIAIGFIIAVIKYPTHVWVYVLTLLACVIPIPLVKLYSFFESTPPSPEKVRVAFLSKIKAHKSE